MLLHNLNRGLLGREPELVLAIRAKSIKDARENMELIEKKVKRRTPVKIKTVNYKDFEINYVEMKGFFRLFFGKLLISSRNPIILMWMIMLFLVIKLHLYSHS